MNFPNILMCLYLLNTVHNSIVNDLRRDTLRDTQNALKTSRDDVIERSTECISVSRKSDERQDFCSIQCFKYLFQRNII